MKLLIVDDNKVSLLALAHVLKDKYETIFEATDGEKALAIWLNEVPDVIITDLSMPIMSGIELIKRIRSYSRSQYTYIIAVTSSEKQEDLENAFDAGVDDYLVKPIGSFEIMNRLKVAERMLNLFETKNMIYALVQMTEARDLVTGLHTERIAEYTKAFAIIMRDEGMFNDKLSMPYIENLALASTLHDIGKVGIRDEILNKPGIYTDDERNEMKKHTLIGADIINKIRMKYPNIGFLDIAYNIALNHHERYDGLGYPNGIKGEEIPVCAKIVAIVDVFDALLSERPYKKAFSFESALTIIQSERGKAFDPILVDIFLNHQNDFLSIFKILNNH